MKSLPPIRGRECVLLAELLSASFMLREASELIRDANENAMADPYLRASQEALEVVMEFLREMGQRPPSVHVQSQAGTDL